MKYDFDKVIERRKTNSVKWDGVLKLFGDKDVLPMWVADMDFKAPAPVIEALKKRAEEGIYGYPLRPPSYYDAFIDWIRRHHDWKVEKEWLTFSPGVVTGLSVMILALSRPGDGVLVQPPVYYPFFKVIENNGRQVVNNPLILEDGRYHMDFEDLEKRAGENIKLMILCSPANPVGRVWKEEDIQRVGKFCLKNNIILISDEIHSDIVYPHFKHTPTATISKELAQITITCMAPSKTFNLAGLQSSVMIIPDRDLRNTYNQLLNNLNSGMDNVFGMVAFESAYKFGQDWLTEFLIYLHNNLEFTTQYFEERIPRIKVIEPEATYLVWLDCRGLGLNNRELKDFMIKMAKVGLDDGPIFGQGGEGFQRLNIACPRKTLEEGLRRIEKAVNAMAQSA
jgi:cystathionine beta-lyase